MQKLIVLTLAVLIASLHAGELTHYPSNLYHGTTDAVKVERGGLVHTRQLLGLETDQDPFGIADLMGQLKGIANAYDSSLEGVAKLNFYASEDSPDLIHAISRALTKNWAARKHPAITTVLTSLPGDAKLACDAVIACNSNATSVERFERDAAVMPANRDILYVSGRAANGELPEATAGTMEQLFEVLKLLGATPADVVQVKAFIKPMNGWEAVEAEIEKSFGDLGAPPVVYVEWSSQSRATEIELIAAAPNQLDPKESVTYFTPPTDKPSPVFSRVARLHADEVIYTRAYIGEAERSPEHEVHTLFEMLEEIADVTGSDYRHFAKATYYVCEDQASNALNQLRPDFYDPKRPPAASKVQVPVSRFFGDCGLLIDIIAAPAAAAANQGEGEWIQLFNGKDLDGWTPKIRYEEFGEDARNTFRVEDGAIVTRYDKYDEFGESFGHLFYKEPFSHYRLRVEYRFTGDQVKGGPGWALRNSGLMLHCQDPATMAKDQDFPVSIEAQILGGDGAADRTTMNLCTPGCHVVMKDELVKRHCTKASSQTYHGDQWVTVEAEVRGGELVKHLVDGQVVLEYTQPVLDDTDDKAKPLIEAASGKIEMTGGWISLQSESHPVEFRKVELLKLAE